MERELARAVSILKRELLFQGLDTAQLGRVASYFDVIEFARETRVFSEGDRPDYFFIIMSGHVRVTRQERGEERLVNVLESGDFFGEMALMFDHPRSASATTQGRTTLMRLSRERFRVLLREYPQIKINMGATAQCRKLLRRLHFDWLAEDEAIYYLSRRHYIDFLGKGIGPILVLFFALLAYGAAIFSEGVFFFRNPIGVIALLLSIVGGGWFWWRWVDWRNDYYIVTNQRVVWQEKIVAMYDSRREAPLNSVLAVNVKSSQWGRILGYGDVDVRTYTGSIRMERMNDPRLFASFVEGYKQRAQALSGVKEFEEMGKVLKQAFRETETGGIKEIEVATAPPDPRRVRSFMEIEEIHKLDWRQTFLKMRYEEETMRGKIITYRKHWFLLLQKTIMPLTVLVISFLIVAAMAWAGALPLLVVPFIGLFWLVLVGWVLYDYLDWNNDIYRLTPEQIMDIERKPLGREQKKTSSLGAPDFRVEHTRDNLINNLLDFGNVTIKIGQTEFLFRGVYNPDRVHQDVTDYREEYERKREKEKEKRDRERIVKWLIAYREQTEELEQTERPD
jgi:hypothetical protein